MKKAFTLIEALIVIFLLAMLLAIAIPNMNFVEDNTLNMAGRNLKMNLNYVRSLAIRNKTNYTVEISLSGNSYKVKTNNTTVPSPHNTGLYEETFNESAYNGVEFLTANFNGLNKVEFTTTGKLVNDGEIILKYNSNQITLSPAILTGKFDVE
ncbi:MAG: hypothetical protein COA79_02365 [Planctomycetota bacterium]|nr:MAG: hypothetical protein COA79_02365 [Planctomycetota bacterium]